MGHSKRSTEAFKSKAKKADKPEFSKRDTAVVKGMAILFLVAYHCFSSKERLNGCDVSFYPLSQEICFKIFESMNICVGMFAFLSAYGLTKTMKFKNPLLNTTAKENTEFVTKRTVSLIGAFFMPFVIGLTTSLFIKHYNPYGQGAAKILNIILDMLGLAGLLHTPLLIGTWWYMSFALVIIFLIPFTVALYKKFGVLCLIPYAVLPVLFYHEFISSDKLDNMTRWLLTIPVGVIFADCDILEKCKQSSLVKNRVLSKLIKLVIFTAVLIIMLKLRNYSWGKEKFYYYISTIVPVFFVYYMYEFITDIPVLNSVLAFLGKHSSNIFFMHTFIRAIWFPKFTYSFGHAFFTYIFMLGFSLAISMAIMEIQKLLGWDKLIKKLTQKILCFENKMFSY